MKRRLDAKRLAEIKEDAEAAYRDGRSRDFHQFPIMSPEADAFRLSFDERARK